MIYLKLFLTFLKIGAFTFGGGYAMIPLVQEEVLKNGWMGMEELVNFVAVSESTPGPLAVNMSTYIGAQLAGIPGALCATAGVVLPSFVIILLLAKCYLAFKQNKIVAGCMSGLRPAVVGLIAAAAVSVGKTVFFPDGIDMEQLSEYSFLCAAVIFGLIFWLSRKKVHPILLITISALLGMAGGYV